MKYLSMIFFPRVFTAKSRCQWLMVIWTIYIGTAICNIWFNFIEVPVHWLFSSIFAKVYANFSRLRRNEIRGIFSFFKGIVYYKFIKYFKYFLHTRFSDAVPTKREFASRAFWSRKTWYFFFKLKRILKILRNVKM